MPSTVKGHVELLPSGNYRVRVYAGIDPVTGRERRLKRTVKTEAKAAQELANLRRFLPSQIKILTGGRAAEAYRPALKRIGAIQTANLDEFSRQLEALRKPGRTR